MSKPFMKKLPCDGNDSASDVESLRKLLKLEASLQDGSLPYREDIVKGIEGLANSRSDGRYEVISEALGVGRFIAPTAIAEAAILTLGAIEDERAIGILLKLADNTLEGWDKDGCEARARDVVQALENFVAKFPSACPISVLQRFAKLPDLRRYNPHAEWDCYHKVDCEHLRQFAKAELSRRI